MDNNYLKHYGVLGMKWGIRRSQAQLDGAAGRRAKRRSTWSEDARTASELKAKGRNKLSNAELKKVNERMRLEQEYSRLNPNAVQKGWKYVAATVGVMGTALALKNNSSQIIDIGRSFATNFIDPRNR